MISAYTPVVSDGDPTAWDDLQDALRELSGALPQIIALGYPRDEIRALRRELQQYLPKTHNRVPDSISLITWYTLAVAKLASLELNMKIWVIKTLCSAINETQVQRTSLEDFVEKLGVLRVEGEIGNWNMKVVDTTKGKFLAVYMASAFPIVEKRFSITYSKKGVEELIRASGGEIGSKQKFDINKDLSKNAQKEGDDQVEQAVRSCALIPLDLIQRFDPSYSKVTPGYSEVTPSSNQPNPSDIKGSRVSVTPVTPVTPVSDEPLKNGEAEVDDQLELDFNDGQDFSSNWSNSSNSEATPLSGQGFQLEFRLPHDKMTQGH